MTAAKGMETSAAPEIDFSVHCCETNPSAGMGNGNR